ncbi:hypothetical protein [Stutzerimonas stutzeri]|uniref:hypothetical protein n=1 Tax=Stutzerimonas TaxID=2901164 RepID=UPI001BB00B13|nr:hypothetical protein [Stutzerimonas stutzeri]QUE76283.1 hypothetical protein KCX70_01520 [Stutzerimonas stutzeri]
MQGRLTVLLLCMLAFQAHGAFKKDDEAFALRQAELEPRCEAARSEKLAPLREAAFQQCMNAKRGADTEADCRRKTAGENGNRVGGTPRFYDLPACVEAFEHKRQRR